jgi:hypothetical protein
MAESDRHCDPQQRNGRSNTITPVYEALVWELRKQILTLGLTMAQCDDLSGLNDGYTAKALHANTPSGRQAGYACIQDLMDVLFCCGGFLMTIRPKADVDTIKAEIARRLERRGSKLNPLGIATSARLRGVVGRIPIRDFARYAGQKGGAKRREMPKAKRIALARKAAKARWSMSKNPQHQRQFGTRKSSLRLPAPSTT